MLVLYREIFANRTIIEVEVIIIIVFVKLELFV